MTEQKTLNKFEATAAMVRDGVKVVDEIGQVFHIEGEELLTDKYNSYPTLPPGRYTIYQEPPKMKTWFKGYFLDKTWEERRHVWESNWLEELGRVKGLASKNLVFITHEERQFPEVG